MGDSFFELESWKHFDQKFDNIYIHFLYLQLQISLVYISQKTPRKSKTSINRDIRRRPKRERGEGFQHLCTLPQMAQTLWKAPLTKGGKTSPHHHLPTCSTPPRANTGGNDCSWIHLMHITNFKINFVVLYFDCFKIL